MNLQLDLDGKVIPTFTKRRDHMVDAFCRHLNQDPTNVGLPQARQFFAAISNLAFTDSDKVIADVSGAKSNNRTPAVHAKHYSSTCTGMEFTHFEKYHCILGEPEVNILGFRV